MQLNSSTCALQHLQQPKYVNLNGSRLHVFTPDMQQILSFLLHAESVFPGFFLAKNKHEYVPFLSYFVEVLLYTWSKWVHDITHRFSAKTLGFPLYVVPRSCNQVRPTHSTSRLLSSCSRVNSVDKQMRLIAELEKSSMTCGTSCTSFLFGVQQLVGTQTDSM